MLGLLLLHTQHFLCVIFPLSQHLIVNKAKLILALFDKREHLKNITFIASWS